jgi:phosphonopyruvate decarboxylase
MINQQRFLKVLLDAGVDFFTGVPDSYLNGFCNCLLKNVSDEKNVIAANEGNAVAIASGYYFSTGKVPLVYMQNSGIGNAINPLLSLADKEVYSVPMVLLIGWRGEPGTGDHAQHKMQGELTTKLLDLMDIPFIVAEDNDDLLEIQVNKLIKQAQRERKIVAIVARKGVFADEKKSTAPVENGYPLFREEAIEAVLDAMPKDTIYVATTGRATRELYFLREKRGEGHNCDFLNVGSMGHASSVALGLALANKNRKVVCFDGDSAVLMHMGALSMVSNFDVPNFLHVVLNNGAHESVGGQPSAGMKVDFTTIAQGAGYRTVGHPVATREEIIDAVQTLIGSGKASFMDVRIKKGLNGKLPPLNIPSHLELINGFMDELKKK